MYRVLGELRRGSSVLIDGARPLVVLAAETASGAALREAGVLAPAGPVVLAVAASRAGLAAPSDGLAAFALAPSFGALALLAPSWLRELADPTRTDAAGLGGTAFETSLERVALPAQAGAALAALKLARLLPAAVLAETDAGAAARARESGLLVVEAGAVTDFAHDTGLGLEIVAQAAVPLEDASDARLIAFRAADGGIEHLAIMIGDPVAREAPLVRLHSECFTGDFLGSLRCDCGDQLRGAIRRMREDGAGVLLYLAQEGRGIGLVNKLRAYALQDRGLDTLDANRALGWGADERSFLIAATMLRRLGIARVRLLTNNPDKVEALEGFGDRGGRAGRARDRAQRGERRLSRDEAAALRAPDRLTAMRAVVTARGAGGLHEAWLEAGGRRVAAVLGPRGVVAHKEEGDGGTPAGLLTLRRVLYRADRIAVPVCAVPRAPIAPDDGWCDAPFDERYNRAVTLPYGASAEPLWRDDGLYDLVGVLGWNDAPVVRGAGSAIFVHPAPRGGGPTAGCIGVAIEDLRRLLAEGLAEIEVRAG